MLFQSELVSEPLLLKQSQQASPKVTEFHFMVKEVFEAVMKSREMSPKRAAWTPVNFLP